MRLHVLAVFGYTGRARPEEFVTPLGAVSADDIDLRVWFSKRVRNVRQDVENIRIIVLQVTGAVVAQEIVELRKSVGQKLSVALVDNVDALVGVRVVQPKVPLALLCVCRLSRAMVCAETKHR